MYPVQNDPNLSIILGWWLDVQPQVQQRKLVVPAAPDSRKIRPLLNRVPDVESRLRHFTEIVGNLVNSLFGQGILRQTGPRDYTIVRGGYTATRPPGLTDDATQGFQVGATWVNTAAGAIYFCVSNTAGAAVWKGPF